MTTLRCTAKLLKVIGRSPMASAEGSPDDWYANLVWFEGRKCLLLTHAGTLFPIFKPNFSKSDITPPGPFVVAVIRSEIESEGLPGDVFGSLSPDSVMVGRTINRSVLGTMNDLAFQVETRLARKGGLSRINLKEFNRGLRRIPLGALNYVYAIDAAWERAKQMPAAAAVSKHDRSEVIEEVLDAYLVTKRRTLNRPDFRIFEKVIGFFRDRLNVYAYEGLSEFEHKRFRKAYDAGDEQAFCHLFSIDHVPVEVGGFLGDHMIRKVVASDAMVERAGAVMLDLLDWLVQEGYLTEGQVADAREHARSTGTDLPKVRELGELLNDLAGRATVAARSLADDDYVEDQLTISRVDGDALWFEADGRELGPVKVGSAATRIARPGWSVNIVLGRSRGRWQVLEVGNVYPN